MAKIAEASPKPLVGKLPAVKLEPVSIKRLDEFQAASGRSRKLHKGLVTPPESRAEFERFVERARRPTHKAHFVIGPAGELVGVMNLNEIVRGGFQSAYLGYYAFSPHEGKGLMHAALGLTLRFAFNTLKLHRLEANIQPNNEPSRRLVQRHGFVCEGYSARYLKIAGRWRDHERWALTREQWNPSTAEARAQLEQIAAKKGLFVHAPRE